MTGQFYSPYATDQLPDSPNAQAAQREYAKALMTGTVGKGGAQFPVVQSPTQGVSNMVNALMGGLAAGNADYRDRQSRLTTAGAPVQTPLAKSLFGAPATSPAEDEDIKGGNASSFSEGPSSEGHKKSDGEGAKDLSREANAIASIESKGSGDYSAVGPQTRTGDRAYGKYQVMGANVGPWTQEVLGKAMTPQEFMRDPAAQDKVFQVKFAQGGNNDSDRASVWFTGKPLAQGAGRSDGYLTGQQYVDRFNKSMGSPGGSAVAFAGPDGGNQNPAVGAITSALRGGDTQVAANAAKPAGSPPPQPNGSGIYVDPKLVPQRPPISPQQMQGIMTNPWMTPEAKAGYLEQFRNQGQPVEVPFPGGKVVIDPRNPTRQQFIPDLQKGTNKVGDVEVPNFSTVGPSSGGGPGMQVNPLPQAPVPAAGPRSEAAPPPAAPGVAPAGPTSAGPAVASAQPPAAQAAPVAPPQAAPKPVQVASADPAQAFAAAEGGAKPDIFAQAGAPAAPANTPLGKFAQSNTAPPGIPQQVWDMYTQKKNYDDTQKLQLEKNEAKIAVDKEAQSKGVEAAVKKYDTLATQAQSARKQMPNLDYALALMKDPNFYSGIGANEVTTWNKLKAALPSWFGPGSEYSAAPNEVFNKVISGSILDNMRTALGGLGQVRLAEIDLLKKANASSENTPAANRALLEISKRAVQSIDHLDQLGQDYFSGTAVIDPIDGKELLPANIKNGEIEPRHGLDVGYDKLARKFVLDHPTLTPDDIKRYNSIFETGKDPAEMPAPGTQPAGGAAPAVGTEKQFKQGIGVWDGKEWQPKKQ